MGLILGIYRYEHESKSEFKEWSVDVPAECAGDWLREWRERGQGLAFAEAMDEFIQQRCPNRPSIFKREVEPSHGAGRRKKTRAPQDIASAGRCPTHARIA